MAKIDEGACSLFYQYKIIDKNGKIVRKSRKRRAHSFVKGFLGMMYSLMGDSQSMYPVKDINGSDRTLQTYKSLYKVNPPVSEVRYGIVVGTGSNAVSIDDYKLQTKIATGTSTGQLNYGSGSISSAVSTNTTTQTIISRQFSNSSGGSITIQEVGVNVYYETSGWYFLIIRDTVSISLNNGEQLTFNYIIQTTL